MRIRNLSPAQIYQAIQSQNIEVSAGYIGQPIGKNNNNAYQYTLNVQGRLTSPEEFGNIIIRTEEGGKMLRLKDVARIDLGSSSYNVVSKLKGHPTAAIAIYQQPGSNSLDVSKGVKAKMQELAQNFPAGVSYNVTLDTTDVINASIDEVLVTFPGNNLIGGTRYLPVSTELASCHHSMYHHSGITDRYTGSHGGTWIFNQYFNSIRIDTCRSNSGG